MQRLAAVAAGLLADLVLLVAVDWAISSRLVRKQDMAVEWVPADERPYLPRDHGWYELKRDFRGRDYWGDVVYPVATDANGFRISDSPSRRTGAAQVVFLGDSFTYGINGAWADTFVGMYEAAAVVPVANAAVPSYSPTAYLYAYRAALKGGALAPQHTVVVMLDISDVHDEAGVWIDGPDHPRNLRAVNQDTRLVVEQQSEADQTVRGRLRSRLRFTAASYGFVRYSLLKIPDAAPFDQPKSAFTWSEWQALDRIPGALTGYAPLGVAKGLERVRDKLDALVQLARASGGQVFVAVYPWPAQLRHPAHFDWPAFAADVCRAVACAGVIDMFPAFRQRVTAGRS